MSLIKTKITKKEDIYNEFLDSKIKLWLYENFRGNIALDYRNRIRIKNQLIPFSINNKIIFKYLDTFQQNNKKVSDKIRKCVLNQIEDKVLCIGGESYIYGLECEKYVFCSNCKKLCYENDFNSKIYHKNTETFYIENYNKIKNEIKTIYPTVIINLSKLNKELMVYLNNKDIEKIIIINCKPSDFWKKNKYLNKFKINTIKHFITNIGIITVNILLKK